MAPADYYLIIPASGIGSRMNSSLPKQYMLLDNGLTIIDQTLKTLLDIEDIKGFVVAIANNDLEFNNSKFYKHPKMLAIATGGKERVNSVISALNELEGIADDSDWVLVHDAVRPCVKATEIAKLIDSLKDTSDGGLLGIKITDTIKQVDNNDYVNNTIDRSHLWRACTPQMYRYKALKDSLSKAIKDGISVTDEASAMEHLKLNSRIVPCSNSNIKITTAHDISLANYYLKNNKFI